MDIDSIQTLLQSKRTEDKVRAAESLSASNPTHTPILLNLLSDRTPYVASVAARKLCANPPDGQERTLLKAYQERDENGPKLDPGCHIRAYLGMALGKLTYHPATAALRTGIKTRQIEKGSDSAVLLRGNCALALSQIAPADAVRDISLLLFEPTDFRTDSSEARKAAARALGRIPDEAAIIPLALRLTYPEGENADVLAVCMEAAVEREDARALELLAPYLSYPNQSLAAQAAILIARTGDDEAIQLLKRACLEMRGDPLRAVVLALSAVRNDSAQLAVVELAHEVREDIRLAAVEALAGAQDAKVREALTNIAESDSSPSVRRAAAIALQ
jgi:HEAT repeat protein